MARLPSTVQVEDLMQAGMIGLLEASARYDASKGASFETYAGIRIRGSMLDEMRRGDWAPRSVHRNARRVLDAIRDIEHRTGGPATDREVAEAIDMPLEEYHQIVNDAASCRLYSYEEVNDGEDTWLLPSIDVGDHGVEREALLGAVGDAIGRLTEREQLVMALYYDEEFNLKEIGAVLGVSESRVSQILSLIVTKLRGTIAAWVEE